MFSTIKSSSSLITLMYIFGIEGNSSSDGKGEWSEMVRACVEE